ncbi:B-box zinc finger family protein [Perilla frutescens var. frutescens]|nr:B-box zinc finger family protein [Perilla frutescens var. frutescens]
MKIQCDVCEKAPATVICCADEAALCSKCDVEVHAANKLASKHQRLLLQCLSNKLPPCDICQDKPAFIFCVEDRALFCKDCDEPIHSANSRAANHQRFLATGIRVALSTSCNKENVKSDADPKPPKSSSQQIGPKSTPLHVAGVTSPSWGVDDLLQFSDYSSPDKQKEHLEFNELEWLSDISLFGEQVCPEALSAAEVPQLPTSQSSHMISFRPSKSYAPHKKPRIEIPDDDEEFFTVPDLG